VVKARGQPNGARINPQAAEGFFQTLCAPLHAGVDQDPAILPLQQIGIRPQGGNRVHQTAPSILRRTNSRNHRDQDNGQGTNASSLIHAAIIGWLLLESIGHLVEAL
jgi:hypothetical protein